MTETLGSRGDSMRGSILARGKEDDGMERITVHEGAGDERVRAIPRCAVDAVDPEPWTGGQCIITAERDGTLIGVATCGISAGVAHLSELMVAAGGAE